MQSEARLLPNNFMLGISITRFITKISVDDEMVSSQTFFIFRNENVINGRLDIKLKTSLYTVPSYENHSIILLSMCLPPRYIYANIPIL